MNSILKKITTSLASPLWSSINGIARPILQKNAIHLPVPVISVGNIVAGGVGKTEITIIIANYITKLGKKVLISTRGFGSIWQDQGGVSDSYEDALKRKFPDEALVILKKTKNVSIAVGKNRAEIITNCFDQIKPDVVILEDGYQHFRIHRDLDVIVHDFSIKNQYFRDLPSHFEKAKVLISFSEVPKFWSKLQWNIASYQLSLNLPSRAISFCGIGNPERFKKSLESRGVEIIHFKTFSDHYNYSKNDLQAILQDAQDKSVAVLTTWKDYVKCLSLLSKEEVIKITPVDIEVVFKNNPNQMWEKINEIFTISHS